MASEIKYRISELQKFIEGFIPTELPIEPTPSEVMAVREDLSLFAAKVDAVVMAYAQHVETHTGHSINPMLYIEQLQGALDGNLFYEIESAAEILRNDAQEQAYRARHNHETEAA